MTLKRLWYSFRLCTIRESGKRTEYIKKKHIYADIGENVTIMSRVIPLYAELIKFHDNVQVASGVSFITHDITHIVLNKSRPGAKVQEKVGCIEIMNNVFIGTGTKIMYDVRIGNNVIVAAGSIVTRDIPDNCVVAGVPARIIGSFDGFADKRMNEERYPEELRPRRQRISGELAGWCWEQFEYKRNAVNKL